MILSLPTRADFATVSRGEHQATAIYLPLYSEGIIWFLLSDLFVPKHLELHSVLSFYYTDLKSSQSLNLKLGKTHLKFRGKKTKFPQQPELKLNPLDSIVSMSNSYLFIDAAPRCYTFTVGRNVVGFFFVFFFPPL